MVTSVQELCHQQGLSLLELADRSGVDLIRVRAIYLGRWTPTASERQSIAAVLQVQVEDIAWGHQIPIQHLYGHGPG